MNFYNTMLEKFGKKKTAKIVKAIKDCLGSYVASESKDGMEINHPEYCNAFGIMQGVAYALGYEYCAITSKENMPGLWFAELIDEMENELAVREKMKTLV